MFCSQCGKEMDEDANFCSKCGGGISKSSKHDDLKNKILHDIAQGERICCNDPCCTGIINTDGICGYCSRPMDMICEPTEDEKLREYEQRLQWVQEEQNNELKCPRCGSIQLTSQKKGFSLGKAVTGGLLVGYGIVWGLVGKNKIKITCLKCGHSWKAGKA